MNTDAVGDALLCAWLVAPQAVWIQTRLPHYARKLSQRRDSRLVARGVAGGYLRTYEIKRGLAWAKRFIARHTQNETPTNARKTAPVLPPARQKSKNVR